LLLPFVALAAMLLCASMCPAAADTSAGKIAWTSEMLLDHTFEYQDGNGSYAYAFDSLAPGACWASSQVSSESLVPRGTETRRLASRVRWEIKEDGTLVIGGPISDKDGSSPALVRHSQIATKNKESIRVTLDRIEADNFYVKIDGQNAVFSSMPFFIKPSFTEETVFTAAPVRAKTARPPVLPPALPSSPPLFPRPVCQAAVIVSGVLFLSVAIPLSVILWCMAIRSVGDLKKQRRERTGTDKP
jgi:hypothetical protein